MRVLANLEDLLPHLLVLRKFFHFILAEHVGCRRTDLIDWLDIGVRGCFPRLSINPLPLLAGHPAGPEQRRVRMRRAFEHAHAAADLADPPLSSGIIGAPFFTRGGN